MTNQKQKRISCIACYVRMFVEDSEEYYWHLKIHNAELERAILNKQFNLLNQEKGDGK